ADRGRGAAAGERALARVAEQLAGALADPARVVVELPELHAVPIRLFEVVAKDLLELRRARAADRAEPPGEQLVQLRAPLLGDACVGGVADEGVAEAEGVARPRGRARRPDQVLAHE